jgi:RsiW-degrading membrane proteinase PrsW (M82 family)
MRIRVEVLGHGKSSSEFDSGVVTLGRERDNIIQVPDTAQDQVSRYHAELRGTATGWRIVDLDSVNGVYLNGRRVIDALLSDGDLFSLAKSGPRFRVSLLNADRGHAGMGSEVKIGDVHPWNVSAEGLFLKGYLPHALVTVGALIAITTTNDPYLAMRVLLYFLTAVSVYVIYLLCGKQKPWWLLLAVAAATVVLATLITALTRDPFLALAFNLGGCEACSSLSGRAIYNLLIAAIPEELTKMIPVLGLWYASRALRGSGRNEHVPLRHAVTEPLDGLLLGFASAAGFTALEATGYVAGAIGERLAAGDSQALFSGFWQTAIRSLGHTFGHGAYSGIFGYYVGLAAFRPGQAWQFLAQGFLIAIGLHTAWNATAGGEPTIGVILSVLGWVILVACIIQGRKISPTRHENFATRQPSNPKGMDVRLR